MRATLLSPILSAFLLLGLSSLLVWLGLKLTGQRFADSMRRT